VQTSLRRNCFAGAVVHNRRLVANPLALRAVVKRSNHWKCLAIMKLAWKTVDVVVAATITGCAVNGAISCTTMDRDRANLDHSAIFVFVMRGLVPNRQVFVVPGSDYSGVVNSCRLITESGRSATSTRSPISKPMDGLETREYEPAHNLLGSSEFLPPHASLISSSGSPK
jgi:hypothetical protein